MRTFIIVLWTLFFSCTLWANETEVLNNLIPAKLKSFSLKKTTRSEVQKIWGKADLVEGMKEYYSQEGVKYPVEFSYDRKGILKKVYYRFVSGEPPRYEQLKTLLENKVIEDASKDPKHKGEFFMIKLPEAHLVLKFRDDKNKTLDTLIWQ